MSGLAFLVDRITHFTAGWLESGEALRAARQFENAQLQRYHEALSAGADQRKIAHAVGNARGQFYEHMLSIGVSHAVLSAEDRETEFACVGGVSDLGDGALSRSNKGGVTIICPSFRGGAPLVRAEFDGLIWDRSEGPVLIELTSSSKNCLDLVADVWRKQLLTMTAFDVGRPAACIIISPEILPTVDTKVANLVPCTLPFPDKLWATAIAGRRAHDEVRARPKEAVGPKLRGGRMPDFPSLMADLAEQFIGHVRRDGDLRPFCSEHRDHLAMAGRVYIGSMCGSPRPNIAQEVARLIAPGRIDSAKLGEEILSGRATVHLTIKVDAYHKPIRPIIHVLTGTAGRAGEYRIDPAGESRWVKDFHKANALRNEIPLTAPRQLDVNFINAAIVSCRQSLVLEPNIRRSVAAPLR